MSANKAVPKLLQPVVNWMAIRYQAAVGDTLRKYGLRYDDLLDPWNNLDVDEALKRVPLAEVDARNQRLKRALDLSLKRDYLSNELQAVQKPFAFYLADVVEQVEAENKERAELGAPRPYDRTLP